MDPEHVQKFFSYHLKEIIAEISAAFPLTVTFN